MTLSFNRVNYLLLCLLITLFVMSQTLSALGTRFLNKIEQEYGQSARKRITSWRQLVADHQNSSETEKLILVNDFFNQVQFVSDLQHWGKQDYWATPVEMLSTNGGDCEDFSIAKYFTLVELGVPVDKIRLTYVKAVALNQAHMVVTYFPDVSAEPLVLDNLVGDIKKASSRKDLLPVYSFNGEGLWLAKERSSGRWVGSSKRISLWATLLKRMQQEKVNK